MSDTVEMKKVNPSGIAPTPEQIKALEDAIGHKIPQDYIDLISDPNAAFPRFNSFPAPDEDGGFTQSSRLPEFIAWKALKDVYDEFNVEYEKDDEDSDFPPFTFNGNSDIKGFLPIVRTNDSPELLVCLNVDETRQDYGAVYFTNISWDFGLNELVKLAPSVSEFMRTVQPPKPLTQAEIEACARAEVSGDSVEVILARAAARRAGKKVY